MEYATFLKSWRQSGVPLVPLSLRRVWALEALPVWVTSELGLAPGATFKELDGRSAAVASARVRKFLGFLLQSRSHQIDTTVAVESAWPVGLSKEAVPWMTRTVNCLINGGLYLRLESLPRITFGDLFAVQSMGALSILDFACTLEAAIAAVAAASEPAIVTVATGIYEDRHQSPGKQEETSRLLLDVLLEPWADWVSEQDPRFVAAMPSGSGTLAERIDTLTSDPESTNAEFEALAIGITKIREIIEALEHLSLESQLSDYLIALSKVDGLRLAALSKRLNWDGSAAAITLEEAGTIAGVSRERMRQIQARTEKRMPKHAVVMPGIDAALRRFRDRAPLSADSASQLLKQSHVSRISFHPASVIAAARACGRSPDVAIDKMFDVEMVVASPNSESAGAIARAALRASSSIGVGNIADVVASLESRDLPASEEIVREYLNEFSPAEFFDEDWFWFPNQSAGSIKSISQKMLAVTSPLNVGVMREGLKRAFRFRESANRARGVVAFVPPRDVLAWYFKADPDFALETDSTVRSIRSLNIRDHLSPLEQLLVSVLRSTATGILERNDLIERCIDGGANANTIGIMLTYSPLVSHLGTNLWTLRGALVDPAAADAIRKESSLRPREQRVADFGWTQDGLLWVAYRLPSGFRNQILGVPAAIGRFVQNRDFVASSPDGLWSGYLRIYENGLSTGHQTFLRRSGADAGDLLLEKFDLVNGTVELSILDDDDLEKLSPQS